jgi:N-acetylglutamate synthase-like GNAT family acetyltransferase
VLLRQACTEDATSIHTLILEHQAEGRLLPRELVEIGTHAHRFVVAEQAGHVIACAELAPLSRSVAEVRSLVVSAGARSVGVGTQILDELIAGALAGGFEKICAFSHAPAYFVQRGFSIVPHVWLPEKIVTDCHRCSLFRRCGQYALVRPLHRVHG